MTVADTDVLIDYLADRRDASQVATELANGSLRTTVVSRFELLSGAQNPRQLSSIVDFLAAVPSLILDEESVDRAAEIHRFLENTGQRIGMAR